MPGSLRWDDKGEKQEINMAEMEKDFLKAMIEGATKRLEQIEKEENQPAQPEEEKGQIIINQV